MKPSTNRGFFAAIWGMRRLFFLSILVVTLANGAIVGTAMAQEDGTDPAPHAEETSPAQNIPMDPEADADGDGKLNNTEKIVQHVVNLVADTVVGFAPSLDRDAVKASLYERLHDFKDTYGGEIIGLIWKVLGYLLIGGAVIALFWKFIVINIAAGLYRVYVEFLLKKHANDYSRMLPIRDLKVSPTMRNFLDKTLEQAERSEEYANLGAEVMSLFRMIRTFMPKAKQRRARELYRDHRIVSITRKSFDAAKRERDFWLQCIGHKRGDYLATLKTLEREMILAKDAKEEAYDTRDAGFGLVTKEYEDLKRAYKKARRAYNRHARTLDHDLLSKTGLFTILVRLVLLPYTLLRIIYRKAVVGPSAGRQLRKIKRTYNRLGSQAFDERQALVEEAAEIDSVYLIKAYREAEFKAIIDYGLMRAELYSFLDTLSDQCDPNVLRYTNGGQTLLLQEMLKRMQEGNAEQANTLKAMLEALLAQNEKQIQKSS